MEYYSAIKRNVWVSSNDVDKSRAYYTEWSKSEREKQMSYINSKLKDAYSLEGKLWPT